MIEFKLHQRQSYAFHSPATEILYGGAKAGGKSMFLRMVAVIYAMQVPGIQVYLFRRSYKELVRNHLQGSGNFNQLLNPLIEEKVASINTSDMRIDFDSGSRISLCHLQHESNLDDYLGAEINVLLLDEAVTFTEEMYTTLRSLVRIGGLEIPEEYKGRFPRIISATNPGGVSHNYWKSRFVDYGENTIWRTPDHEGGMLRQYVPAKLSDNPTITENDPHYAKRIMGMGDPESVKAMLDGDWNITSGGAMDDLWNPIYHVVEPFDLTKANFYFSKSYDYGSSAPYGVLFFATLKEDMVLELPKGKTRTFKKGSEFLIDEIYGADDRDRGLYETVKETSDRIKLKYGAHPYASGFPNAVADASIFDVMNGNSIGSEFGANGIHWNPSDKSKGSRVSGLSLIRGLLRNGLQLPMEDPGLFFFSSCVHSIRTIPTLPRDTNNMEDVDTSANDHLYDTLRYNLYNKMKFPSMQKVIGY